ncbi:MAG TPA: TRAM domain-containing protein [Intrasporangium sp.]|uniref:class I SAM-dependent RNA methyltransferase n=1 Tax=Intrasporangium sp. TaxID=1925024 RepID=UPI002D784A30|nr:TRAM domain-containing protein [Intrasporangium sp.]HET7397959.1 TRAM domain-containing protein [Intrasporangium sp.]
MTGTRRPRERPPGAEPLVGSTWTLDVGPVAHGGHCVARHEGQVVFVRHALPGERVVARVTEGRVGDRFLRADAVEVLAASPHRVPRPCPYAVPGQCGGCDWQHVELAHQRTLKTAVVREQFRRLAGLDVDVTVAPVPGDEDGLRWRTRVEFAVGPDGRAGLHEHRSTRIVPIDDCLIATREVISSGVLETQWQDCSAVDVIAATRPDEPVLVPLPRQGGGRGAGGGLVGERVEVGDWAGEYVLAARGFWQVHPGAAATFLSRVLALLAAGPGDRVLDLYAGSGLFALPLGERVQPGGSVLAVEGDRTAVDNGIRNTEGLETVEWRANRVDRELRSLTGQGISADLAVLDPPRTGAGRDVMSALAGMRPRRIVYVACDPAALARDVKTADGLGYRLTALEAYDAFPMTHHVECIALLEPQRR